MLDAVTGALLEIASHADATHNISATRRQRARAPAPFGTVSVADV